MANILAIDDEIPILELIKNGLQKDGHRFHISICFTDSLRVLKPI